MFSAQDRLLKCDIVIMMSDLNAKVDNSLLEYVGLDDRKNTSTRSVDFYNFHWLSICTYFLYAPGTIPVEF